jgi:hypothetical protein
MRASRIISANRQRWVEADSVAARPTTVKSQFRRRSASSRAARTESELTKAPLASKRAGLYFDRMSLKKNIKKKPRIKVAKEARRRARLEIGAPPAERIIPDKRTKPLKHKKKIVDLEPS